MKSTKNLLKAGLVLTTSLFASAQLLAMNNGNNEFTKTYVTGLRQDYKEGLDLNRQINPHLDNEHVRLLIEKISNNYCRANPKCSPPGVALNQQDRAKATKAIALAKEILYANKPYNDQDIEDLYDAYNMDQLVAIEKRILKR